MGVRFIVGRAGTGKSLHCFRSIVEMMKADPLGPPIYWIVPKQETFSAERDLTCGSGLGGFCRARVVSFELLGEEILAECGGTAIPQVTSIGRQMIIGHLLRKFETQLVHYASAARQVGLAAELDGLFAEMERSGKTSVDLATLITEIQDTPETSSLAKKLQDLQLLYEQYLAYLGQERLDPHRRLAQVIESLESCQRIKHASIFVDGFLEFTDFERKMLVGLAKSSRDLQITLLLDPASPILKNPNLLPDELSLFHKTETAYRSLWFALNESDISPQPPLKFTENSRCKANALKRVETLFDAPSPGQDAGSTVTLVEAPDRRGEVDAAARKIQDLLQNGLRLRDIAVLMRRIDDYQELIEAGFTEHGIAYFADRRRTAGHHPLLQFTRAALQIALHGWPHEAVMTLLKTELADLNRDEVDELENYVLLHRIRGGIWGDAQPWTYRRKLTRATQDDEFQPPPEHVETAHMDTMRRKVSDRLEPLFRLFASKDSIRVKQFVVELCNTFERFAIRTSLQEWIKTASDEGRLEEASEHQQVWTELTALLDQMVDVVGDQTVDGRDFVDVLDTGLDAFDLALTPPTVDQVLVGSVDRTRGVRPRAVILLGMNDDQFPRRPQEDSLLSDSERTTMRQHRIDLDPDTERGLLDERLLGYIAFTRASEHLCLTRSISDEESHPQSPSPFWTALRGMFPAIRPLQIPRESVERLDCIGTPRQLVTSLMRWVRQSHFTDSTGQFPQLYHWLATHDCSNDPIDTMRFRAWKALSYRNEPTLSEWAARELFKSPLNVSVSQIETFAACPFKHFVTYGLRLSEREDQDITAIDLGNVCHGILERIVRQMLKEKSGWKTPPPALVKELAQQLGKDLRGELMLSSARNQYILKHIEKTIEQALAAQSAVGTRGHFTPWRAELQFGDGREIPALKLQTPQGRELKLKGKIDRVDRVEGQSAFAVIDYKYRGSTLALDWVYHGLSLQLLTYMLVLQNSGIEKSQRLTPAAAFYVKLLRQLEKVNHPDEATQPDDPLFDLGVKPRGIIDWNQRDLIDPDQAGGTSDLVQLYVKQDNTLGRKNVSDACETNEFAAMLKKVRQKLGELADGIMNGTITAAPYRIAQSSPCVMCTYRSVCRFDAKFNEYHILQSMKREDVLRRVVEESES